MSNLIGLEKKAKVSPYDIPGIVGNIFIEDSWPNMQNAFLYTRCMDNWNVSSANADYCKKKWIQFINNDKGTQFSFVRANFVLVVYVLLFFL